MANRIKELIEEIEYTYLKIGSLHKEAAELRREGKNGKAQSLAYTVRYLKRKMFNFRERFKLILKGSICFVKYLVQDQSGNIINKDAILVNVSDEEISDILSIYCRFNNFKLNRILEIKRISTKLG